MKSLNFNYDDFYKFLTSFTIVTTILSIYAAHQQILKAYSPSVSEKQVEIFVISFYFYIVFLAISISLFIWAMWRWKKNQEILDNKLSAEADLKIAEVRKTEAETTNKILGR